MITLSILPDSITVNKDHQVTVGDSSGDQFGVDDFVGCSGHDGKPFDLGVNELPINFHSVIHFK
jgi:hypothetical protein